MDAVSWSFVLIGLALAAAGTVGVLLPQGERLAAVLPLVVGAGVGILTLAFGASQIRPPDHGQGIFLLGSILGFITTIGLLAVLWRRTTRAHRAPPDVGPS